MYPEMGIERERFKEHIHSCTQRWVLRERERFKGTIHSCTQRWVFRERGLRAPFIHVFRDGYSEREV